MDQKKCLIIDKMHESIVPMLQELGFMVDYQPNINRQEILEKIHLYTGLVVRSKTAIDAELIAKATLLRFIARAGAGIDQLDVESLEQKNIAIINAPEGNRDALAEHTVGMLLSLFNKIHLADRQVRNGIWDRESNRGVELKSKTIALIGYGYMGKAFAERLTSFGCNIIAYDKYLKNYGTPAVREVSLDDIWENADILSLHIPLTPETRAMVNNSFIDKFKKPIYLINTARGEIGPFENIYYGLSTGKILGAALDVLENEKIAQLSAEQKRYFDAIAKSDKVILTPHVAGWTFESYEKINQVLVAKIKELT